LLAIALATGLVGSGCVSVSLRDDARSSGAPRSPSSSAGPTAPATLREDGHADPTAGSATASLAPGQRRIGYLSLDERTAFVATVSTSIREAAAAAGAELVACDPGWTREGVVACAQQLADAGIQGALSFQPFSDLAPEVCAALGVPTVGIVFDQGSCQVSRLRIDQAASGRLAGEAVGRFAAEAWDCQTSAYLSLESNDADPEGRERMAGYRAGYEEHCPLPERTIRLDDADRLVTAQAQVARRLADLPGRRIIIVGLNEDAILGAMAAASAAGRQDETWYSGQLADAPIRQVIACDDHYIASVAQFPEHFGALLLPVLEAALQGRSVPPFIEAPLELVTADNVREIFPDTAACDPRG
jgi:ABC-type sugar transport system substrate-binding protein